MKIARKITLRILQEIRNLIFEYRARISKIKSQVTNDVPFVCQFATPEHAELSLKKQLKPIDDPEWKNSGALSPNRYADWAFTMCGMASLAMILQHFHKSSPKPAELAEDALSHGVYRETAEEISDMRYREFASWARKYHLKTEVYTRLSLRGIKTTLSQNKLVIASVNPNIRGFITAPTEKVGGHLVVITGYDDETKTITINNPSGFTSTETQKDHQLTEKDFLHYFAGRGLVVSKK